MDSKVNFRISSFSFAFIFQGDCVGDINTLRNLHVGTDNLAWSDSLAAGAQSWAEHIAAQGKLSHASKDERNGHGENLYWSKSRRSALCADAVLAW